LKDPKNINIPIYKPFIAKNTKKYVNQCLADNWLSSQGPFISQFESNFSQYLGVKYSSAVTNGTVALHLALLALKIGKNDEVLVPNFTYIASVNCLKYVGAKPVIIDVDRHSWNIDCKLIEAKITKNTKAIMAVHIYGNPCQMDQLQKLCKKHNIFLIEDAAEALGAKFKDKYVGSFGDIATFSFFGNKTITTGEGGMVVTKTKKLLDRVNYLKNQAVSQKKIYWHDEVGYNYRMTNLCAAIGCSQLEEIGRILKRKKDLFSLYKQELDQELVSFQHTDIQSINSFWMIPIVPKQKIPASTLIKHLSDHGIDSRPLFFPVTHMPVFKKNQPYPVASYLSKHGIYLPSYPDLTDKEVRVIAATVNLFLTKKNGSGSFLQ
jgi:perosamine synthetase